MHREHQTWRPFKLLHNSNKTKLFTVPSVSVRSWRLRKDRGLWTVYNKTWHFTNQFFHPFPLSRTQALLRIFNGSWGTRIMRKFQKRKGTREGSSDHDTLRRVCCRKSQEAHGYEAASSYWSSWQRSWWVTDTVMIKISLLTCPTLENFKQGC